MSLRSRAAVLFSLLSLLTAGASAQAQAPVDPPVRVAFAREHAPGDKATRLERGMASAVANGIGRVLGKRVQVVEAGADADAVVDFWLEPVPKGTAPGTGFNYARAKVDGRDLTVSFAHVSMANNYDFWASASAQLGHDVGTVIRLRTEPFKMPALDDLITQLGHTQPAVRARAASLVSRLGAHGKAAVPALVAVLEDTRSLHTVGTGLWTTAGREAAKALVELGAHRELIAFFRSNAAADARAGALIYIAIGGSPGSSDVVLQALDDSNGKVRTSAARVAGAYVRRAAAPRLIEIVDESRGDLREAARSSLAHLAGQDFKLDADAWRQWWSEQQGKR